MAIQPSTQVTYQLVNKSNVTTHYTTISQQSTLVSKTLYYNYSAQHTTCTWCTSSNKSYYDTSAYNTSGKAQMPDIIVLCNLWLKEVLQQQFVFWKKSTFQIFVHSN